MMWQAGFFIWHFGVKLKVATELWYNFVGNQANKEAHYHLFQIGWYKRKDDPDNIVIFSLIIPFISFRVGFGRSK